MQLSQAFAEMMFKHGFVHCDPHAANVLVRPLPSGNRGIFGKAFSLDFHLEFAFRTLLSFPTLKYRVDYSFEVPHTHNQYTRMINSILAYWSCLSLDSDVIHFLILYLWILFYFYIQSCAIEHSKDILDYHYLLWPIECAFWDIQ